MCVTTPRESARGSRGLPAAAASVRIRTHRSGAYPPARSEDVLEFVDVNFTIIVYTLTWTACVAGIAWSALMSAVIVHSPGAERTPTVLVVAAYVRCTGALGIVLLLVPFLRCAARVSGTRGAEGGERGEERCSARARARRLTGIDPRRRRAS